MAVVIAVFHYWLGMEFGTVDQTEFWSNIVMQVAFVACAEEMIFRNLLPEYLRTKFRSEIPVVLLSQASFAFFHWGVYGGNYTSLLIAFIIGLIWVNVMKLKLPGEDHPLGLGFTIGSHAAYNLVLIGVFAGNINYLVGG
jgi:membrane protease YdiL (CAAX protease family)